MAIIALNPVFSSIHGKMGSTVFVFRNGAQFIRRHVVPEDPKTYSQLKNRNLFASCITLWKNLPQNYRDSWNLYGSTLDRTGYNLFISENMKAMIDGKPAILFKMKYLEVNKKTLHLALTDNFRKMQFHKSFLDTALDLFNYRQPFKINNLLYHQRE